MAGASVIDAARIKDALACGKARCGCRTNGNVHCPSHADGSPSLSVKTGDKVPVIVSCHAGCAQDDVIAALRARNLWPENESTRVIVDVPSGRAATWHLVKEWPYPNDGSPRAYHGREEDGTETIDGKPNKRNRWRLPDGTYDEGLKGTLKLSELPLYNAHLLAQYPEAGAVLVEGEKAADCAVEHGLIAVSLPGGAAQRDFVTALDVLKDREVWLWPDAKDTPSADLMAAVKAAVPPARYVNVPDDLPAKGDAVEYFALGHAIGALFVRPLRSRSIADFMASGSEPCADAVTPIAAAGITWLYGGPGTCKTATSLEVAATKATGRSYVGWDAEPGRVLYVAGDMSDEMYRPYMRDVFGDRLTEAGDNFRIWMTEGAFYFDDPESVDALQQEIEAYDPALVIFDHFGKFVVSDGFSPKELKPAIDAIAAIRRAGRAILMVDETRKEGGQGGSRPPTIDQLFGGRAKASLADRAWSSRKDEATNIFTLSPAKVRGMALSPISLQFGPDGLERVDAAELSGMTPAYAQVLACIAGAHENLPRTKTDTRQLTSLSERQVHYAIKYLLEAGVIEKVGTRGRAATYRASRVQGCNEGANSSAKVGRVQRVQPSIESAPFACAPLEDGRERALRLINEQRAERGAPAAEVVR